MWLLIAPQKTCRRFGDEAAEDIEEDAERGENVLFWLYVRNKDRMHNTVHTFILLF